MGPAAGVLGVADRSASSVLSALVDYLEDKRQFYGRFPRGQAELHDDVTPASLRGLEAE